MGERVERPGYWRPDETIDLANEAEVREWAVRLCVTPNELREIIEEISDRSACVAAGFGVAPRDLGHRDEPISP